MANKNQENDMSIANSKKAKDLSKKVEQMLTQAHITMYGTEKPTDTDELNDRFNKILNTQVDELRKPDKSNNLSFIHTVFSMDKKSAAATNEINEGLRSMTDEEFNSMQSLLAQAYRNRMVEQSDLHEVASSLIELNEAIGVMTDAIISPDTVDGRMNLNITFENIDQDETESALASIHAMENKFDLRNKIKKFVVPDALEYGEYGVYHIPYSKIFNDFQKEKDSSVGNVYHESVLTESVNKTYKIDEIKKSKLETGMDLFLEDCYDKFTKASTDSDPEVEKSSFKSDVKNIMERVSVSNSSIPLPILEEGCDTWEEFKSEFMTEDCKHFKMFEEKTETVNLFNSSLSSDGTTFVNDKKSKKKNLYDDISDCYVKMLDPMKIIPVEIMGKPIGYYYVQSEDVTPLSGVVSSTLYYSKFDEMKRQHTVIDSIAERVIQSFDKPFLQKNAKFKELIVECINYYNLNEKRLKFQFIPEEYITIFKIDVDENGHGRSMIRKSLFYAKLYLMLLLFKIMSIILYSNDQKVNYIKSSGLDKDIYNKIQDIARIKQSRQINMMDLFNYTTLVNKVGQGNEMYVPVGRSGERPIETEILSGQEVQLNTELLEMLKNAYILGTGVPATLINYLNEVDFAKQIEQNNTKFNGRVINYQLDLNIGITEMYKKLAKWCCPDLSENTIDKMTVSIPVPKTTASTAKADAIDSFMRLSDFLCKLLYDDPDSMENQGNMVLKKQIATFRKNLAKNQLPMINFDEIEKIKNESDLESQKEKLKPSADNGNNGDDYGLGEEIDNTQI